MRFLFKLLVLAALVYGGWWVWKNYDLPAWYNHVKSAIDRRDTRSALVLPKKHGETFINPNTIHINANCEFSPKDLEIKKGERVVWQNASGGGQELVGDGFGIWILAPGRNATKTYNEVGNFYFNCLDKEQSKGQIIVK